ncbi:hypothetical protein KCU61_g3033, partial [Aureobasidium melanogenum]
MGRPGKNTARWRHLSNGYNRYWYSKAALRWLALTAAVVALITFGVSWRDYSLYSDQPFTIPFSYHAFSVAGLLFSVLVDVSAMILLFRIRKRPNINPGIVLAGDTLVFPVLTFVLAVSYSWSGDSYVGSVASPMVAVWGLIVGIAALHALLFFAGIWETHVYRAMRREGKMTGEADSRNPKRQSRDLESETNSTPASPKGPVRIELADGRIFELPEGCKVELPAESRSELPAQLPGIFLAELEAPVPPVKVNEKSEQDRITAARSVVDNLLAIHTRNAP